MNSKDKNIKENHIEKIISDITSKKIDQLINDNENHEVPTSDQSLKMYAQIISEIQAEQINPLAKSGNKENIIYLYRRAIAAAIIIVVFATAAVIGLNRLDTTVKTEYAQNRNVILPDGSTVILNAKSSLRYSKNWKDAENRKVWLDGEGYFSVVKGVSLGQKFEVITNGLSVVVEGT
ncbi:MAG TPA: FecR domain-containing protein, partial [Saprospiraceae bacterium]|nr:FecR domain-containing protein [Saprospiraceae bacterium]